MTDTADSSARGLAPTTRHATALARPPGEDSQVLAQASGAAAGTLIELARAHDIPVLQDVALSTALGRLPPGSRIPEGVFIALGCTLDFLLQQEENLAPPAAAEPAGSST